MTTPTRTPEIICGRKVWIDRAHNGGVPQVWIYLTPTGKAAAYFSGVALGEGDAGDNKAFLEGLCRDVIEAAPRINALTERTWSRQKREADAWAEWSAERLKAML